MTSIIITNVKSFGGGLNFVCKLITYYLDKFLILIRAKLLILISLKASFIFKKFNLQI